MSHIPVADLEFTGLLARDDHGLRYLGPTLRGVLGYVLKETVCSVAHGECARCHLRTVCPYPMIFDGRAPDDRTIMRRYPTIPQPFVLRVAPPGTWEGTPRDLHFGIRLFGAAVSFWPYLIEAFRRAGERGIGGHRTPFRLMGVQDSASGRLLYLDGREGLEMLAPRTIALNNPPKSDRLRITFETPLSLRVDGDRTDAPTPLALLLAARRRVRLMSAFYGGPAPIAVPVVTVRSAADQPPAPPHVDNEDFEIEAQELKTWSIERFSGRQQQRVPLAGVFGEMVVRGPWPEIGGPLFDVQNLHLGKHTSFGFGRVRVQEL